MASRKNMNTETTQVRRCTTSTSLDGSVVEIAFLHPETEASVCFQRSRDEPVSKALARMESAVEKKMPKSRKKLGSWRASLFANGTDNSKRTVDDAFQTGKLLTLSFETSQDALDKSEFVYSIVRNPPTILDISIMDLPLVGFPVYCQVRPLNAGSLLFQCYVGNHLEHSTEVSCLGNNTVTTFFNLGPGATGQLLSVKCTPASRDGGDGEPASVESTCPVHTLSDSSIVQTPLLERISRLGPPPSHETIRVMTYNVQWMRDNTDGNTTTNPSCTISNLSDLPVSIGSRSYRQQILANEILRYRPGVVCLQEVVKSFMESYLLPFLVQFGGYKAIWETGSEIAMFYDSNRFVQTDAVSWTIANLLDDTVNKDVLMACRLHGMAEAFLRTQPHEAQAVVLKDTHTGEYFTMVNCHLVQKPVAEQMRALQSALLVRSLQKWDSQLGDGKRLVKRILAGDFNTCYDKDRHGDGVAESTLTLLKEGRVDSSHYGFLHGRHFTKKRCFEPAADSRCQYRRASGEQCEFHKWEKSLNQYCWDHTCTKCFKPRRQWKVPICSTCTSHSEVPNGCTQIPLDDMNGPLFQCDLSIYDLKFADAYEVATGIAAPFRNIYARTGEKVTEARDHIFFDEMCFKLLGVADPVELDEAIPSLTWPSDHLALVADFESI